MDDVYNAAFFEKKEIMLKIINTTKLKTNDAIRLLYSISAMYAILRDDDEKSSKLLTHNKAIVKHITGAKNDFIDSKYLLIILIA